MIQLSVTNTSLETLSVFTNKLLSKNEGCSSVIQQFRNEIVQITPFGALKVFNWISKSDHTLEFNKNNIDRLTYVFYKVLTKYHIETSGKNAFFDSLILENNHLLNFLEYYRPIFRKELSLKEKNSINYTELLRLISELKEYGNHLEKLEKVLFPLFIKVMPQYSSYITLSMLCYTDYRLLVLKLEKVIKKQSDPKTIKKILNKVYYRTYTAVWREELVFFPVCQQYIHENIWKRALV